MITSEHQVQLQLHLTAQMVIHGARELAQQVEMEMVIQEDVTHVQIIHVARQQDVQDGLHSMGSAIQELFIQNVVAGNNWYNENREILRSYNSIIIKGVPTGHPYLFAYVTAIPYYII